jgi:hypothetical protein
MAGFGTSAFAEMRGQDQLCTALVKKIGLSKFGNLFKRQSAALPTVMFIRPGRAPCATLAMRF